MLASFITLWLLSGLLANLLSSDIRLRFASRVLLLIASTYFFWIEGTPSMERFKSWAQK